jgi:hypothetical protein
VAGDCHTVYSHNNICTNKDNKDMQLSVCLLISWSCLGVSSTALISDAPVLISGEPGFAAYVQVG